MQQPVQDLGRTFGFFSEDTVHQQSLWEVRETFRCVGLGWTMVCAKSLSGFSNHRNQRRQDSTGTLDVLILDKVLQVLLPHAPSGVRRGGTATLRATIRGSEGGTLPPVLTRSNC